MIDMSFFLSFSFLSLLLSLWVAVLLLLLLYFRANFTMINVQLGQCVILRPMSVSDKYMLLVATNYLFVR